MYDEDEEPTGEVITVTQKTYKFVPKTNVPKIYLIGNDDGAYTTINNDGLELHSTNAKGAPPYTSGISKIIFNDTELTVQQLVNNYKIVQVGSARIPINAINESWFDFDNHDSYLEYLDWIRNNTIEIAEVPILLYSEKNDGSTRDYNGSFGFNDARLFLNGNQGYYSQTVYDVIEGL